MNRFSIIIPHKGPQEQLARCVASIPERCDVQVIVVNDKDGHGAGWARNKGLEQATGDYVIFADSDDFFHPCFNAFLDTLQSETADVIFFNADSIDLDTGHPSWRANHLNRIMNSADKAWQERHLRYYFTEPWCKVVKMSLIRLCEIRFSESRILNDIFFSTQVGIHARSIKVHTGKCYCIGNHAGSTAKLMSDDRLLDIIRETAKSNMLLRRYSVDRHHSRMLRPLFISLFHCRPMMAGRCWQEMRRNGYSKGEIVFYIMRYPRDLSKLLLRKMQSGEIRLLSRLL